MRCVVFGSIILSALVCLFAPEPAPAQRFTIRELPPLSGGTSSSAVALNDKGEVAGASDSQPVLWRNGVPTDLAPGVPADQVPTVSGINNLSQVAGSYNRTITFEIPGMPSLQEGKAEVWSNGQWTVVDGVNYFQPDYGGILTGGINDRGHVAVRKSHQNYVAAPEATLSLVAGASITSWTFPQARLESAAINNTDQIAGDLFTITDRHKGTGVDAAILWDGGPVQYPALVGAYDINDAGRLAGYIGLTGTSHAALWDNGQTTPLPELAGTTLSRAVSLNETGWTVGSCTFPSGDRAVLWHDGVVKNLNVLVPFSPIPGENWTLTTCAGVNERGQVAGNGTHNGQKRAFLLTPIVAGDADGNGIVALRDVVLAAQTAAGQGVMIDLWAADIAPNPSGDATGYGDRTVDLKDAIAILRIAGGL